MSILSFFVNNFTKILILRNNEIYCPIQMMIIKNMQRPNKKLKISNVEHFNNIAIELIVSILEFLPGEYIYLNITSTNKQFNNITRRPDFKLIHNYVEINQKNFSKKIKLFEVINFKSIHFRHIIFNDEKWNIFNKYACNKTVNISFTFCDMKEHVTLAKTTKKLLFDRCRNLSMVKILNLLQIISIDEILISESRSKINSSLNMNNEQIAKQQIVEFCKNKNIKCFIMSL